MGQWTQRHLSGLAEILPAVASAPSVPDIQQYIYRMTIVISSLFQSEAITMKVGAIFLAAFFGLAVSRVTSNKGALLKDLHATLSIYVRSSSLYIYVSLTSDYRNYAYSRDNW